MKIIFLANHLNVGGITSYLLSLGSALVRRGHTVYVASSAGDALTRFTANGIIFIPVPIQTKSEMNIFKLGASFLRLKREIADRGIELVHSHSRVTQVLGAWLSRSTGRPHVMTWHGFFRPRLSRRIFPCWPDRVIAISDSVAGHLAKDFRCPAGIIRLVYSGIDTEALKLKEPKNRQELKNELGLGPGPVIGIVARLSDVKGHQYLIEAMPGILKRCPDAQLFIVGEGKTEQLLRRRTHALGLTKQIVFTPRLPAIQEAFYVTDVFVMPSVNEGLGLGLMEAMAWGKAVVGSAVGGIKNLISHGQNGLLVRAQDPAALSAAVIELLDDPVKAATLGNNARRSIAERFSLSSMVEKTEEVYRECLDARGLSGA